MTSELRRVRATFSEDNPLVLLALGVLSTGSALDRLLSTHAPGEARSAEDARRADDDDPVLAAGVDFVLGLLALRERVLGHLDAACPDADAAPQAPATPPPSESIWR